MVSKAYIFLYMVLTLFFILVLGASSFSEQRVTSKFAKDILGSKKGDKVKGLDRVIGYLVKYGYLDPFTIGGHKPGIGNGGSEVLDHSIEEAIKKFQTFFHLDVSGVLDAKTLSLMTKPRCGYSDLINGSTHGFGQSKGSHYVLGPKWNKLSLTWALKPNTRQDAHKPIYDALGQWAFYTKFNFTESNYFSFSDLKIGFYRGNHGDSGVFDGPGGAYAHAGMPPDGGVHFDADENWVVGAKPHGLDIGTVALHELGHAIGLAHSTVKAAIMWPYLAEGETKSLNTDDITGIKALYNFP